jgi:hypothetical protein
LVNHLGFMAFPPFVDLINREFGWKISMIISGSIVLQCCVLGALLKPVELKKKYIPLESSLFVLFKI